MDEDVKAVWVSVQAELPEGWTLESLRCASAGLEPEQRSADWVAVAIGPRGETREARTADAVTALRHVADYVRRHA